MWICSQHGFYSIVRKGTGNQWHVRSRRRRDLVNLIEAAGIDAEIFRTTPADYRWRIVIRRAQLTRVMAALQRSIDYPNFKARIHQRPDQADKANIYADFWALMLRHQIEE